MLSARGHHRNDKPPIRCPLCSCTGHYSALQCREFQTTRREKKPTDIRETEDMAATSEAAEMAFSKTTRSSVRRADARLPRSRHRSIPFRPQYVRFPLPTPRNWPPRNQGPPSRRYDGAANAANDSAIDGDGQGDPNQSKYWRHAGPSSSCSASKLTTRGETSAFATSPPAKSSCVRPSYGTPQPTPQRQFPETR